MGHSETVRRYGSLSILEEAKTINWNYEVKKKKKKKDLQGRGKEKAKPGEQRERADP